MAAHVILLPDVMRGRELRSIVWDDEAGSVEGEHSRVATIRDVIRRSEAGPVTVGNPGGTWDLRDPAHDPAEFLTLIEVCIPGYLLTEDVLASLPSIFRGVELPPRDPGEQLFDIDPDTGESVELT